MVILRRSEFDPAFDATVNSSLKGKRAQSCLEKIELLNGVIIAADLDRGQWQDCVGETLFFVFRSAPHAFGTLRTDDDCVSWSAMGNRVIDGVDRLIQMATSGMDPAAVEPRIAFIDPVIFATRNGLLDLKCTGEPSYHDGGLIIDIESGHGYYLYRLIVKVNDKAEATDVRLLCSSSSGAQDVATGQEALDRFLSEARAHDLVPA